MTDRPILMSAPMVRAILEGRKTQTRRIVRTDKHAEQIRNFSFTGRLIDYHGAGRLGMEFAHNEDGLWHATDNPGGKSAWVVPINFAPGDRLWVRETWAHTGTGVWTVRDHYRALDGHVIYRADEDKPGVGWFPSIHMPRKASRLTLEVTDVRVERLQEISEGDAVAEGTLHAAPASSMGGAVDAFSLLWDDINAKRGFGWDENPWVVAITFVPHQKNIDQMEQADD